MAQWPPPRYASGPNQSSLLSCLLRIRCLPEKVLPEKSYQKSVGVIAEPVYQGSSNRNKLYIRIIKSLTKYEVAENVGSCMSNKTL